MRIQGIGQDLSAAQRKRQLSAGDTLPPASGQDRVQQEEKIATLQAQVATLQAQVATLQEALDLRQIQVDDLQSQVNSVLVLGFELT